MIESYDHRSYCSSSFGRDGGHHSLLEHSQTIDKEGDSTAEACACLQKLRAHAFEWLQINLELFMCWNDLNDLV